MKNSILITTNKIYRVILSISIAVSGVFLILGCLMIYRFGEGEYSRQAVADIFLLFAFPICLSPVLALGGWILNRFVPYADKKHPSKPDLTNMLIRLYGKKDRGAIGKEILVERKKRQTHADLLLLVLWLAGVVFLFYACNGSHFDRTEINQSMIRAMWVLLPCLAVSFAGGVLMLYSREKSLRREFELVKQLPNAEIPVKATPKQSGRSVLAVRIALIALAALLLGFGLFLGGAADVLTKAINICTECIGLG